MTRTEAICLILYAGLVLGGCMAFVANAIERVAHVTGFGP